MRGILMRPWKIAAIATNPDKEWQTRRAMQNQPTLMDKCYEKDFKKDFGGRVPRYQVGEVVYIKEAWRYFGGEEYEYCKDPQCVIYRNDALVNLDIYKWHNPRTMPAWAARYFIKILAVEACRTRDIAPEDCEAEGITSSVPHHIIYTCAESQEWYETPQLAYFALYDSINGKGAHESNYDFKYTFKLVPEFKKR